MSTHPFREPPPVVTTGQLAGIFKVTPKTIAEWVSSGLPKIGHGRFNLADVVRWRRARDIELAAARPGPLREERRRLIAEQRRGHEIANAKQAASLLPVEDVSEDIRAYSAILDAELDALVDRAAAAVREAGGDQFEAARRLRAVCRAARVSLAAAFEAHGRGLADDGDGATD